MPIDKQILIHTFAMAIGLNEGVFRQAKILPIPQRLANPMCLVAWKDPKGKSYPVVNGYCRFPRCERIGCQHPDHPYEIGWAAGRAQVKINLLKRHLSTREFFVGRRGVYLGFSKRGDRVGPTEYAQKVFAYLKQRLQLDQEVTIDTPLWVLTETAAVATTVPTIQ